MTDDTISRQSAVDAFADWFNGTENTIMELTFSECKSVIKSLPSTQRELTNNEKEILIVMFKNMNEVIHLCGGYLDIHGESFGVNDLFCLADKLGVVEEY